MGKYAFSASLSYHDQDLTDVYAAFVSNKIRQKGDLPDTSSIEMFITMLTSKNASFISHSGIARTPIYTLESAPKHPNLAVKLHSSIAACAKDIYSNKKEYMITVPVKEMTQILLKEYEKKGVLDKIYIGHRQENLGNKQTPIKLINDNDKTLFSLYDKNGNILHELTAEQMKGEFAWFCTHPHLFKDQDKGVPLVTCDLETLATLDPKPNPIEHEYYLEIIGEL
ncbi:hypothetical protein JS55_06720 [Rickettsia felis str. LSU]|nr:hypothetical protein JS55_06720 [Rickettsia felis str. LSU]KHO02718.1 hypothetical protein JS61_06530 [Rickettsia felis]